MRIRRLQAVFSAVLAIATLALPSFAQQPAPYGGKDFYPTPDRPVGFRGDGNGYFPGATPVTQWFEGTPIQREGEFSDPWGKKFKDKYWDLADNQRRNIVWKTPLPCWANTQPIVVGDRVFTTAEPDMLVCLDANTGRILWSARNNVFEIAGLDKPLADKLLAMFDLAREVIPNFDAMAHVSTMTRIVPVDELQVIVDLFAAKAMPAAIAELNRLDPQTKWFEITTRQMSALRAYMDELRQDPDKRAKPSADFGLLRETVHKRITALSGLKLTLESPWGNHVGWCMSVPVSDGRSVYVSFGQGQVVCFDLNGKRLWAKFVSQQSEGSRMSHIQSPLLAGDILIDMHGGSGKLRGLNARTGEVVWEAPTAGDYKFGKGGGYYVGSHKIIHLRAGNGSEPFVLTTLCNIIRVRDGKSVGALPFEYGPSGGPSMTCSDDIVLKSACGDNYSTPIVAFRLKYSGDKVEATKLWETKDDACPGYTGVAVTPGFVVQGSRRGGNITDVATGKIIVPWDPYKPMAGYGNLVIGNYFVWVEDGSNNHQAKWTGRRADGKALAVFHVADISDPAKPKRLSDNNLLGGSEDVHVPLMEKLAPELYASKIYYGSMYGKPAHALHTDNAIFPAGNRLFIRSVGFMYCIGDPATPYDWNPASRPQDIAGLLAKPAK